MSHSDSPTFPISLETYIERHKYIIISSIIAIVSILVFIKTIKFEFLTFDDPIFVTQNSMINRGITVKGILWAFDPDRAKYWHPITWLSHMLDCEIFGLNPVGHHMVNLIFHVFNSILLYLFLLKLTEMPLPSAVAAVFFSVHPLHVESVAWVSDRKDLLCAFFMLLTLISYVFYIKRLKFRLYLLVCGFYALSILSKLASSTLPLLLVALDIWFFKRHKSRSVIYIVLEKLPLFVISGACIFITILHRGTELEPSLPLMYLVLNSFVVVIKYIQKIIFPSGLFIPYLLPGSFPVHEYLISLGLVLVVSIFILLKRDRCPFLIFGWLWFLILIIPVLGLVPNTTADMADRYTYIPMAGIIIMIIFPLVSIMKRNMKYNRLILMIIITGILLALIKTSYQLRYWKNTLSLFNYTLRLSPDNYVAHATIGAVFLSSGELDRAEFHLRRAVSLNQEEPSYLNNYGYLLLRKGNPGMAIYYLSRAREKMPQSPVILKNLGLAHLENGNPEKAIKIFNRALSIAPDKRSLLIAMARAQFEVKDYKRAIYYLRKAIRGDKYDEQIRRLIKRAQYYQSRIESLK